MKLPRLQLFEFNDAPWAPAVLRETLTEALSRAIRWGKLSEGLVEPLAECLRRSGTSKVMDLCAGAGGPAIVLSEAMARRGHDVHFLMSDLYPSVPHWEAACAANPERLGFIRESVDATAIPRELAGDRVRVIINALHHFPPSLARAVIRGAAEGAPGVFIGETLTRNPLSFYAMAGAGLAGLYSTPFLAKNARLAKTALTWLSPIALAASAWDGTVSSMRTYTSDELHEMVSDLPGWEWSSGTFPHSFGLGTGNWFAGVPTTR
ncbi:MAG: hypothetical protein JNM17_40430 [Archangium sp.]|nr:hypothetical protein [Archangium sp.]